MGEAQVVQLLTSSCHEQRRAPGVGELPLITVRGGERAHVAAMTPFILDDLAGGEEQDATSMRVLFDDVVQQSVGLCRLSDPDAGVVSPDVGVSKPLEPAIPLGTDELLKRGAIESRGADVPPEPHVGEGRRLEPSRLFQGGCRFQRSLDGVTTSPVTPGKGRQLGFRPLWRLRPIFRCAGVPCGRLTEARRQSPQDRTSTPSVRAHSSWRSAVRSQTLRLTVRDCPTSSDVHCASPK